MQNINIILMLIIVLILSSITIFKNRYWTSDNNTSNNTLNNKTNDESCILYENTNRIQNIYLELINVLKNISNKRVIELLPIKTKNIYIQGTTDNYIKEQTNQITDKILTKINKLSKFNFEKNYYDDITIYEDNNGNKNFVYNVFLQYKK